MKTYFNTDCMGLYCTLLLLCIAQLCPICSSHPSCHPFIPLTCSSLFHGMDRNYSKYHGSVHAALCLIRVSIHDVPYQTWVVRVGSKMRCGFIMIQGCPIGWWIWCWKMMIWQKKSVREFTIVTMCSKVPLAAHGRLCGILKEIKLQNGQPLRWFKGLFRPTWP